MYRNKRKRKAKQKLKIIRKRKAGKLVRFVLTNSGRKYSGWSNRYNYQSNIHSIIYKDATFSNDKFQNCIITGCNFNNANLSDIDFTHCNLKGSSFKNAVLSNVTFFNCNMKDVNFDGAVLKNVAFICMSLSKIKNLPDIGYSVLNQYPNIEDRRLLDTALALSNHNSFYKYHVFHVDKYKVNNWYLYWLAEQYPSYEDVSRGLYALKKQKDKSGFITVASYKRFLDRYLKI